MRHSTSMVQTIAERLPNTHPALMLAPIAIGAWLMAPGLVPADSGGLLSPVQDAYRALTGGQETAGPAVNPGATNSPGTPGMATASMPTSPASPVQQPVIMSPGANGTPGFGFQGADPGDGGADSGAGAGPGPGPRGKNSTRSNVGQQPQAKGTVASTQSPEHQGNERALGNNGPPQYPQAQPSMATQNSHANVPAPMNIAPREVVPAHYPVVVAPAPIMEPVRPAPPPVVVVPPFVHPPVFFVPPVFGVPRIAYGRPPVGRVVATNSGGGRRR